MLAELLEVTTKQGLISRDTSWLNELRKMFAHGSDAVLNPPMFLDVFELVTALIGELYAPVA